MVVVPIIFHFVNLGSFAGGFMIHHWMQHHQGYRLHLFVSPGKPSQNKKLIKKDQLLISWSWWYQLFSIFWIWNRLPGDVWYIIGCSIISAIDCTCSFLPANEWSVSKGSKTTENLSETSLNPSQRLSIRLPGNGIHIIRCRIWWPIHWTSHSLPANEPSVPKVLKTVESLSETSPNPF